MHHYRVNPHFCDVKQTSVKVSLQQWYLPLTTNISLNGCEWKITQKNACSRCFWQKMKYWWGKDTDQKITARSLTMLIFAVWCMGIVWSTTTRTRVNDATAVTFSVKRFNPLKLYPLSGNIFRKLFASYFLFIRKHLIIMLFPKVKRIAVTTLLLTSGLHRC